MSQRLPRVAFRKWIGPVARNRRRHRQDDDENGERNGRVVEHHPDRQTKKEEEYVVAGRNERQGHEQRRLSEVVDHIVGNRTGEGAAHGQHAACADTALFELDIRKRRRHNQLVAARAQEALAKVEPKGDAFWWIACESRRAQLMRKVLTGERGVPKDWIRATGYWKHAPDDA